MKKSGASSAGLAAGVTMYDIAGQLGVSIAAVSRAFDPHSRLRPEKRALILKTAEELGYVPNKTAARLSRAPIRLGVLIWGEMETYYREHIAGIRAGYESFFDYKLSLDLRVLDKKRNPSGEAYAVLDEFIASGLDGVIVSGLWRPECAGRLNMLAEAGIPFYLIDSDVPGCRRLGVSMNDTATAGRMAAQLLGCSMGPGSGRKAAVMLSDLSYQSQSSLAKAFTGAAPEYGFSLVRPVETHNSPEAAVEGLKALLAECPSLDGVYIASANSASVCRYVRDTGLGGKLRLVTSDLHEEVAAGLRDGTIFATIYQDPFSQAFRAFEALLHVIADRERTEELLLARPQAVFKSNLSLYEPSDRR